MSLRSKSRSSELMAFCFSPGCSSARFFGAACLPELCSSAPVMCVAPSRRLDAPWLLCSEMDASWTVLRWRTLFGTGKWFFLSTDSTVRWKRRNNCSALIKLEGRSIVLDNSLTTHVSDRINVRKTCRPTVLENFIETAEMVHNDVSVLF